jgi:hypothetical protein
METATLFFGLLIGIGIASLPASERLASQFRTAIRSASLSVAEENLAKSIMLESKPTQKVE